MTPLMMTSTIKTMICRICAALCFAISSLPRRAFARCCALTLCNILAATLSTAFYSGLLTCYRRYCFIVAPEQPEREQVFPGVGDDPLPMYADMHTHDDQAKVAG